MDLKKINWKFWILLIVTWSIGITILIKVSNAISFDCPEMIRSIHLIFFLIGLSLILIPFSKSIKIGKLIEIEREINQAKEEIKDFKTQINQSMTLISSSINASISSMNSNISITLPGQEELKSEIDKLKHDNSKPRVTGLRFREQVLESSENDYSLALAKTRIEIERLLREQLGKRTLFPNKIKDIKYVSLNKLFYMYNREHPEFEKYYNSFKYVQSICNAAIHGQKVSTGQAMTALELGEIIINDLKSDEQSE